MLMVVVLQARHHRQLPLASARHMAMERSLHRLALLTMGKTFAGFVTSSWRLAFFCFQIKRKKEKI